MKLTYSTPETKSRRFLTGTIALALSLIQTNASFAVEGQWTEGTPMPTARFSPSAQVLDGKIYAIGGVKADQANTGVNEVYDPATATWTTKAPMPTPRSSAGSAVVNGKIYMIGGALSVESTLRVVEEYDPDTDTWTTKAPMPTQRAVPGTFIVDGKIHVISGFRGVGGLGDYANIIEVYDPETDTWEQLGATPISAQGNFGVSVADGRMYQFGGTRGTYSAGQETTEFDPEADTWTRKAPMPFPRHFLSASTLNGKIYAMGGTATNTPALASVQVYDPQTDTWEHGPDMPTVRRQFASVTLNGKIYAFGGISGFLLGGDRGTYHASMDIYTPAQEPGAPPLGTITRTASGTIEIALPEGETYDIEYSQDLGTGSWSVIQAGVSGRYEDTDPVRTARSEGFYRGVR